MNWTDERVALLKQLWGEGKTAAEIAGKLGGVSRNAVIGKAHRLKLSGRVSPIQQNAKPAKGETAKARRQAAVAASNFAGNRMDLVDLDARMCRWPNGDPQDDNFSFCGCQTVPSLPYCPDHARAAYQVSTRGRTLNADDFADDAVAKASTARRAANG